LLGLDIVFQAKKSIKLGEAQLRDEEERKQMQNTMTNFKYNSVDSSI